MKQPEEHALPEYYGPDDWGRIEMCLSCARSVCNNCLERVPHPEGRRKKRIFRPRRKVERAEWIEKDNRQAKAGGFNITEGDTK